MNDIVGLAIIAIAIGSLAMAFLWKQVKTGGGTSPAAYKYQAKPLLEQGESEFFLKLKEAMHGYEIFPRVAMLSFLRPTRGGAKKDDAAVSTTGTSQGYANQTGILLAIPNVVSSTL